MRSVFPPCLPPLFLRRHPDSSSPLDASQAQKLHVSNLLTDTLPALTAALVELVAAEEECTKANVEENDYTVLRAEDLRWELELIQTSLGRRVAFIENQVSPAPEHTEYEVVLIRSLVVLPDRVEGDNECESTPLLACLAIQY